MNAFVRVALTGVIVSLIAVSQYGRCDDPSREESHDDPALGVFMQQPSDENTTSKSDLTEDSTKKAEKEIPDYRVFLESGETLDIGDIFRPEIQEFQQSLRNRLRRSNPPMIRLYHDSGETPMMFAERRGKVLDGLFASFADNGAPIAHMSYAKGDRTATLLTWDEKHRPLVFAQYSGGKLDGIRCLFRGCCDACTDGHVWLVQHWKKGVLEAAHLVNDPSDPNAKAKTFVYRGDPGDEPYGATQGLADASIEIEKFEKRLDRDEKRLKLFVAKTYVQEKQAAENRMRLQNLRRSYQLASATESARFPSVPTAGMAVG